MLMLGVCSLAVKPFPTSILLTFRNIYAIIVTVVTNQTEEEEPGVVLGEGTVINK